MAKSSSQPKSTYEATASLTEFELKKILLDKIQKSKSYRGAQEHKDLYDALVKYYKLEKDLFESYGNVYSLKRDREDKDKYEDPSAGSDQELKKRKTSKDVEPPKGYKSNDSKSSSSKGTKSQPKSSGKSMLAEELVFETTNIKLTQDQGGDLVGRIAQAEKPSLTFDKLMSTPIDFFAYVLNNLKIENLTQEHLVGPAFNLLKGTCRSREIHDFYNKTKAAKYDTIEGIEDTVPSLWSPVKSKHDVFSTKRIITVTHVKVMKKYDYGYLEEIVIRREDQTARQVQKKLSNLDKDDLYDLNVALQIFTRRVVILKQVEDLQLGVESY
ncbi:hypothetical protein Tco_0784358 [Tanacetum coccineum]